MEFDIKKGLAPDVVLPHEANFHLITPYFKHIPVENIPQSEIAGRPVHELKEVCELRFAGDRNYSPVVPADSMYRKNGLQVITYAERWSDQYRAFKTGDDQTGGGTALEYLKDYGCTPAQLSICRAMKIYSIEALASLDGANLKSLGMSANDLKAMAQRYLDDRMASHDSRDEMQRLRDEIAALKKELLPAKEPTQAEIDEALRIADAEANGRLPGSGEPKPGTNNTPPVINETDDIEQMDDAQLRAFIGSAVGKKPDAKADRATLLGLARSLTEE